MEFIDSEEEDDGDDDEQATSTESDNNAVVHIASAAYNIALLPVVTAWNEIFVNNFVYESNGWSFEGTVSSNIYTFQSVTNTDLRDDIDALCMTNRHEDVLESPNFQFFEKALSDQFPSNFPSRNGQIFGNKRDVAVQIMLKWYTSTRHSAYGGGGDANTENSQNTLILK